ncbi:MAG: serine acetyltransferase [Bacteroidetes bacterium]|nr:serine acetyltransferase [Bacteroidota bacterium]
MEDSLFFSQLYTRQMGCSTEVPNKTKAEQFIDGLRAFLFPEQGGHPASEAGLALVFDRLKLDFRILLQPLTGQLNKGIIEITALFFQEIPDIYRKLIKDAEAIIRFDPAATCLEEVIIAYPGFRAIVHYRVAHCLHQLGIPLLPRIITEYAHSLTGIDIHPGAVIGERFFIDHGTGVVIGETTVIGEDVKIYQGVTLGALSVEKSNANTKRHPTLEDRVTLYAGSTILGGETVIGHDTVIGGNVWLTESVPAFSLVYHKSEKKIRNHPSFDEPINFTI